MDVSLFINSDTCLKFKTTLAALAYASRNGIDSYMVLTTYSQSETCKVWNPYLTQVDTCVEYFKSHNEALKYIGSFLT